MCHVLVVKIFAMRWLQPARAQSGLGLAHRVQSRADSVPHRRDARRALRRSSSKSLSRPALPLQQRMTEVQASIDRVLYYAGWADKYQQIFSSVNPVSSSPFQFQPAGTDRRRLDLLAPKTSGLAGPALRHLPDHRRRKHLHRPGVDYETPAAPSRLSEVLATSDLPGGVINLLTGDRAELLEHFASHMDVNATLYCGDDAKELATAPHQSRAECQTRREL